MGKLGICALAVSLLAAPAFATPTTFNFTSGEVTLTATRDPGGGVVLAATTVPLDGVFVTFDAMTIDLTDLLITIPTTGTINLSSPYGDYDQFVIESADISPGTGFATLLGQDNGGGNYSFLAGPLDINGVYSATDTDNIAPPIMNVSAPFTDESLISASINVNTGTLTMSGITLATLPGEAFGEPDDLSIKADIVFTGVVPEPGTGLMLGLGLAALAAKRRRISFS